MSRIAYVNGRYLPHHLARVHVEDRGYQFADSAYEVIAVHLGHLIDAGEHLDRLDRSLTGLRISWPMARPAMQTLLREMVRRNRIVRRGAVYLQVSRGVAPRNHAFPASISPSLVMTARHLPPLDAAAMRQGVAVFVVPDLRWKWNEIKSTSLVANVLSRQRAAEAGAFEAWMVDDAGEVTEGTASNAWIVTADGTLVTRQADRAILGGVTRQAVLGIARKAGVRVAERPFHIDEAKTAREAFLTSTTSLIKPVIRIDGWTVGNGGIGPLTERLLGLYLEHMEMQSRGGGEERRS
jgi:D-alanine transaminase